MKGVHGKTATFDSFKSVLMLVITNYFCIMLEMKNSGLMAVALQADELTDA